MNGEYKKEVDNSWKYKSMLFAINTNLINTFLLRDKSIIKKIYELTNTNLKIIYILLEKTFDSKDIIISTLGNSISSVIYLYEKYEKNELGVDDIMGVYYMLDEDIENLKKSDNDLFVNNMLYMEYKKMFDEFMDISIQELNEIYHSIINSMRNIYDRIDESLEFIENNKEVINSKIFLQDKSKIAKRIFISYTHKDASMVTNVKNNFKLTSLNVWFDEESIRPAQSINEEIKKGIKNSDYFLLFDSENSRKSDFVKDEINYALECFKISERPKIVRLLIDDVAISHEIKELGDIKYIKHSDIDNTIRQIYMAIGINCIEINPMKFRRLINILKEFVGAANYVEADPNLDLSVGDFEIFEELEYILKEDWLINADMKEDCFIRESSSAEYDWEFYNSDRVSCLGAYKTSIIQKLLDRLFEKCVSDSV